MKVHSESARISALDTWLRDADGAEATQMSAPADTAAAATQIRSAAAERDTAEVLLGLEVWNAVPGGSRQLTTNASPPQQASAASTNAQAWADYIVSPLV